MIDSHSELGLPVVVHEEKGLSADVSVAIFTASRITKEIVFCSVSDRNIAVVTFYLKVINPLYFASSRTFGTGFSIQKPTPSERFLHSPILINYTCTTVILILSRKQCK